jgi:hypothetical protein
LGITGPGADFMSYRNTSPVNPKISVLITHPQLEVVAIQSGPYKDVCWDSLLKVELSQFIEFVLGFLL